MIDARGFDEKQLEDAVLVERCILCGAIRTGRRLMERHWLEAHCLISKAHGEYSMFVGPKSGDGE